MSNIEKNTVSAKNQLQNSAFTCFEQLENDGLKVLFLGNSITRHNILKEIGWENDWGMAASKKENDYVHQMIRMINEVRDDASYCICQVAEWERLYKKEDVSHYFENAREFGADIIVMRFIENCSREELESDIFKTELKKFLNYFDKDGKAKIILSTGFWRHTGDAVIMEFAEENKLPCVFLGDLEDNDENMAIGEYWHDGVAHHPSDKGMLRIAERLFEVLKAYL